MKKILFLFCFCIATSAFAQTPTATATATDSPTATPTATASATATATGTPVPTPTPLSVVYRKDTEGVKKAIELKPTSTNQVIYNNAGESVQTTAGPYFAYLYLGNPDDPLSTFSDISWAPGYGAMTIGNNPASFSGSALGGSIQMFDQEWPIISNRDDEANTGAVILDSSLLTLARRQKFQDQDGTIAMLSDIPAANIIGEAHFNGGDPSTASVFGNISGVTAVTAGQYAIAFTTPLPDDNYGVVVAAGGNNEPTEPIVAYVNKRDSDENVCIVVTKVFNPGTLGVVLPSFDLFDPDLVTVVIHKNP